MSGSSTDPPPHPPPLPPNRTGLLQRITAPFTLGTRAHGSHSIQSSSTSPRDVSTGILSKRLPSQTTAHRTGIPILAVDLNRDKTHAVLAGHEILKTIRIQDGKATEDFNLRSAINVSPAYGPGSDPVNQRREFLPAKDVRWSHGARYDTIIATAALNGRIALYDVNRAGRSRVELEWIHQHTGQVNKLDFDPFEGYLLLSGSQDKTVKIWDVRDPRTVLRRHNFHVRHPVRDVKWSPSTVGEFAVCTENGIIQKWDVRNPTQAVLSINAHEKACYTIDWHPDGRHLASGGFDKFVRVWDFKSENRRQKPTFQLRTPQAVMNLGWRPACWSSEWDQTGWWQCTQLATSYTDEDPRMHVWDLRRPLLPIQELDRHNSRPTDLLWASKDFLWTVGYEGMFIQTDVRHAIQVLDELSPCSAQFAPDGSLMTFNEDVRTRKDANLDDPTAKFLRLPPQKFSGATDDTNSRGASDDDLEDELSTNSLRRQQSKNASNRSAKSQGNTPPNIDGFPPVMPLDRSVLAHSDLSSMEQVGTVTSLDGVATAPYVVEFLANNYARPMSSEDRRREPNEVLNSLEKAFIRNAEACDYVSLHRTAQSWRILCAVVVPELSDWANKNRQERLELEARKRASEKSAANITIVSSPMPRHSTDSKLSQKPQKLVTNLFKGVLTAENIRHEIESTSNMTTPLAMPLPDSPASKADDATLHNFNDVVDLIPPLPPSVINSHSTAAAASRALMSRGSESSSSTQNTPEKQRQDHGTTIPSPSTAGNVSRSKEFLSPTPFRTKTNAHEITSSPRSLRTQEDRRAAIRDYRAQARPLFTLETPTPANKSGSEAHPDSVDSFTMFSASTDSSHKMYSTTESYNSVAIGRTDKDTTDWQHIYSRDSLDSTPPSDENGQEQINQFPFDGYEIRDDSNGIAADDAPGFSFGADGKLAVKPPLKAKVSASANIWGMNDLEQPTRRTDPQTTASSASDGMFHFEQVPSAPKLKIYASNPIRRMTSKQETVTLQRLQDQDLIVNDEDLPIQEYVYSDFQPIDFTKYEPKLPFAWSALPLICHTIAFDVSEGPACAQFAVHLLMHLHPFFFNQAFRQPLITALSGPDTLAERLMRPDLSFRIIEGLFLCHHQYLQTMCLFGPMAELKNICVEFDYPAVFKTEQLDQPVGTTPKQDLHVLQKSCATCQTTISSGTTCLQCAGLCGVCPICLVADKSGSISSSWLHQEMNGPSRLWTFCQACGHAAHMTCMQDWLQFLGAEGECPTTGCGCDCGPGRQRDQRLTRQAAEVTNNEIIRGPRAGSNVTKKDPLRATPSPAVDKTRDTLRYSDLRDRNSDGANDAGRRSISGRGSRQTNGSGNGSQARDSFGSRRVRLVTPREQDDSPKQSTS